MLKRIIFIAVLILIVGASVYVGLKPFGIFAAWQDQIITQEQKEEAEALKREAEEQKRIEEELKKEEEEQKKLEEEQKRAAQPVKGIHISLDAKSDQILRVWTSHETIHGAVNVLQSIDTSAAYPGISPLVGLAPYEKALTRTSKLLEISLGILSFEKILLIIFIILAFFIFIPVCVVISIYKIFKQKNMNALPGIAIVSVLISLVIIFAIPASLKLASLADEMVLSGSVEKLISSIDENVNNAKEMEIALRASGRLGAPVLDHIANAKTLSGEAIRDTISYLMFFLITHIVIPVLVIIGLYKLTKFCSGLILTAR